MKKTRVEIINIGDELLIGQVVNTNASWMSALLSGHGFMVTKILSIADTENAIKQSIDRLDADTDVVLFTGGLGPTKDDITKKVLASYFKSDFYFNEEAFQNIESLFKSRGFKVSEINRKQAELPSKSIAIPNRYGTAYGMWFEDNGRILVSMPGVPFEMKAIMEDEIVPRLQNRFKTPNYYHKTIMTTGIGESMLAEIIEKEERSLPANVKLAYLPRPGIVRLRLSSIGNGENQVKESINTEVSKIVNKIGEKVVFGYNDESMEEVLAHLLTEGGLSIATAESCTGGTIAQILTSVPGSSDYFRGGIVSYSNEAKIELLGVKKETIEKHGAVSEQVVIQMAEGARIKLHSDYAIATSGIAGPGGGSSEKPVGYTWIAVSGPKTTEALSFQFGEHRGRNITRAALAALNLLRYTIIKD
jgi:nicotinamide-nucleotide amidase